MSHTLTIAPSASMTQKSDFNDLLFPKRLVLRFDSKGRRKHWHAYRSAVETFIRLKGLESHLQTEDGPSTLELDEKERRRWEADDKLCISIITLNIKGELPLWLGRMYEEGRPAAALWKELCGTGGLSYPMRVGQSKPMSREDDLFVKVLIGVSFAAFITMGFIIVIKAPPSAFETPRRY